LVHQEKRRFPRVRVEQGGKGQLKTTTPVSILNVSPTGLLMEVAASLRPGSTYDLVASVSGVPFTVLVKVTRCRAGGFMPDGRGGRLLQFRAGAEFVNLQPKQVEEIAKAIEKSQRSPGVLHPTG
jgi:PilZ domain